MSWWHDCAPTVINHRIEPYCAPLAELVAEAYILMHPPPKGDPPSVRTIACL